MTDDALEWSKFGLSGAGAVAGGLEAYLQYLENKRQQAFQNRLATNADQRAERSLGDQEMAYKDATVQRAANTLATTSQVASQGSSLRDKLSRLRGAIG